MSHLEEVLKLLIWPLVACISMGLLHGYAGLHVLRRGVIFVDLALAQMAALGAVVGMLFSVQPEPAQPHSHRGDPTAISLPHNAAPPDELDQALQDARDGAPAPHEAGEDHARGFLDF